MARRPRVWKLVRLVPDLRQREWKKTKTKTMPISVCVSVCAAPVESKTTGHSRSHDRKDASIPVREAC